jgi:hypothetical protein
MHTKTSYLTAGELKEVYNRGVRTFYGNEPRRLLWADSRAAHGKITIAAYLKAEIIV